MFREIVGRITNELTVVAQFTSKIKVVAPVHYGLEDFLVFPQFLIRSRRASTMNPVPPSSTDVSAHFRATVFFFWDCSSL